MTFDISQRQVVVNEAGDCVVETRRHLARSCLIQRRPVDTLYRLSQQRLAVCVMWTDHCLDVLSSLSLASRCGCY